MCCCFHLNFALTGETYHGAYSGPPDLSGLWLTTPIHGQRPLNFQRTRGRRRGWRGQGRDVRKGEEGRVSAEYRFLGY